MTRRVDESWKAVQETTFVNWANSIIKGPLKTGEVEIKDLRTDLSDGRALTIMLDNLNTSEKKVKIRNKNPKLQAQVRENLTSCFEFMKEENIKLVNIGPSDLIDGNVKLALGLIWTLIRHYQIRSTGKGLSTKQAMLNWVNAMIPEFKVSNFTSDWNNGIALCYLVDRIQPGLCPQHGKLSASNGLENCRLGMNLAQDNLDIPQIIKPEHLSHPEVDEMSVMTYISYFCKPSIAQLLIWVQSKIPQQNVTNFKTDWNNGINLAALIEAVSPGLFPDWSSLDPNDAVGNLTLGLDIAEKSLEVEPVLKPDAMADPSVDELNIVTYISRFLNTKAVPLPKNCVASGPGLVKGFVKKEAVFNVDATRGGVGKLVVKVKSPSGSEVTTKIVEERSAIYKVSYTPIEAGPNSISIQWEGLQITGSPFTCNVIDPGSISFTGPEITEGRCGKVGQLVVMTAKGVPDVADLSVTVQHGGSGKTEQANISSKGSNVAECTYTPDSAGKDRVVVKFSQQEIPGSPFTVQVVDPSKCSTFLIDPPTADKAVLLGKPAIIGIKASKDDVQAIVVEAKSPSKSIPVSVSSNPDGSLVAKYSPVEIGSHSITVTCAGATVTGSPLSLTVVDPKKVLFFDALPKFIQVGKEISLNINTKEGGEGKLEAVSSSQGTLTSSLKKLENGLYELKLKGLQLGSSDVSMTWSGHPIPLSPFTINVCDATKCSAYGKNLSSGQGKVEELFDFTVQVKNAGKGQLEVNPSGPLTSVPADIKDNGDDTYSVSFTTYEAGTHKIEIKWAGEQIPNSPYQINFVKMDASQFVVRGEGLTKCIAKQKTEFILIGPEAGLIEKEGFKVTITGQGTKCSVVPSVPPISADSNVLVSYEDQGAGNYLVYYAVPKGGNYDINISCMGEKISGCPYDLHALPAPEADKCKAFGKAIDLPNELAVGKPLEFQIDTTNAGTGTLTAVAYDPLMKVVPIFIGEDKGAHNERIHMLKIDPTFQGKHTFEIKWSEQHIPGSPFKFDVGDPSKVIIVKKPDPETYVGKVGEPIEIIIDASHAGPGKLAASAKLPKGIEPFKVVPSKDGKATCTYIPHETSPIELALSYSDISILPAPCTYEVVDPNEMTIVPPSGHGKMGEYVMFQITGVKKSNAKKMVIKATHENHSATVKQEMGKDGTCQVRFTAKMMGKYAVEVVCGQRHIQGSPFNVFVSDPSACKFVTNKVPTVIALGQTVDIAVDTSKCGPGTLSASIEKDQCIKCDVDEVSRPAVLHISATAIGTCQLAIKWAGYLITDSPITTSVVDPSKCTFRCLQLQDKSAVKENEKLDFIVDIAQCGPCTPEVTAKGEKADYKVTMTDNKNGTFKASFAPWQTGKTTVKILVAGKDVPNSPFPFDVLKQISLSQVSVTGEGFTQAIQNQKVTLTIHGLDTGSLKRGQLTYQMFYTNNRTAKPPQLNCTENKNGTYTLTYQASEVGDCKLSILYEGKDIPRSPFNVQINPEPRADKCIVSGRVLEPGAYLNIKDQAHIIVDSTAGGSGVLTVNGKQPDGRNLSIYSSIDESNDRKLHNLIFDAPKVGVYNVSINWEGVPLTGSPFEVRAVDPSRCVISESVPDTVQLKQSVTLGIDSTGAGVGEMNVLLDGKKESDIVTADVVALGDMDETKANKYQINFIGKALGEVTVSIEWGGFPIDKTPFKLSSCDSSACVFKEVTEGQSYQVGVPFQYQVNASKAGKAKLQVKPHPTSSAQYTIDVQSTNDGIHTATITPWTVGEQSLLVMWGHEEVPGSPVQFTVCDPKKCIITGLPDPSNFIPVLGEVINFSIDYSQAGPGEPMFIVSLPDGTEEEIEGETEGKVVQYSYAPEEPGPLTILLEFNHFNLLPSSWVCEVPDPTKFRATPPKGAGKVEEPVKFLITGVSKETENFSITALHPDHNAPITTERGKDGNTIIAYFTPTEIGDYLVHVKHSSRDIDGSPFTLSVANPSGVNVDGHAPTGVYKVGETATLNVDASNGGPGDLTCQLVPLSGDLEIEPQIVSSPDDEGVYSVSFSSDSVGTCQLELKWAEYLIQPSPCTVCFVDPSKVMFSCKELESDDIINQGDAIQFVINGAEAGQGVPEVNVVVVESPDKAVAKTIQDNHDGTFLVTITPWFSGIYHVTITWSGFLIRSDPIQFEVHKMIDSRGITAHGDGLKSAIVGQEQVVVINASQAGLVDSGLLVVKCYDPNMKDEEEEEGEEGKETLISEEPTAMWKDNDDGTYDLIMCYPYEGQFILNIDYNEQPIYQSPFTVTVKGAPSADRCIVSGPSVERMRKGLGILASQQVEIQVDSTEAGSGELQYIATDPSGEAIAVFSHQEDSDDKRIHFLRFSPFDVGVYNVKLFWSEVPLPNTPLEFIVVDPTRCLVQGLPIPNNGAVQMGETISYSIAPSNCGIDTPVVTITTRNDDEVVNTEGMLTETITDAGVHVYHQVISDPDNYYINVTLGGIHIPSSPFKCDIIDPTQYAISGLTIEGKYAYVGDTISFQIQGSPPEGETFSVIAHGPHNDQVCAVLHEEGFYDCTFPVIDAGSYEVYVECANKHLPGSPFQINVADPSKCQVLELPSELQVGVQETIIVKTGEAGMGELTVLINDEETSSAVMINIEQINASTYSITLDPQYVCDIKLDIRWANKTIPQFPLQFQICDASQCKVFGQSLVAKRGKVGEAIVFTVVTHKAGVGKLDIKATGPSAQYTITPEKIGDGKFEAQFVPWQVGPHTIQIFWGKLEIPKSPFSLHIDKSSGSDATCHATGDGLRKAIANRPAQFMLFSSETGLVEKGELAVIVKTALHGEAIGVKVKDENNGSYQVTYVPPNKGAYLASVLYHDEPIPGSPFKINCVAGPDASKCHIDGLHTNTLFIAGKPIEFTVDTSEAGHGQLRVYVQGPRDHHPKVYLADNSKGKYSVKFDALVPGRYFIVVAWSEQHIPGSPFKIRVHPAPDASKVIVSGPGIKDSILGEDNQIQIDTKEAGIGTLLIRVHGIKDAFKIQADPISESEPRILQASYSPTLPGDYDIFIRWSGVHVPGSPFKVNVSKPEGEDDEEGDSVAKPQKVSSRKAAQLKRRARRDTSGTDEEESGMIDAEVKQKVTKKSVGPSGERQMMSASRKAVLKRSQSSVPYMSGSSSGPIKPNMKLKKNPSMGQMQPGMPGRPQYFYRPGGMMFMTAAAPQPIGVQEQVVYEKKLTKKQSSRQVVKAASKKELMTAASKKELLTSKASKKELLTSKASKKDMLVSTASKKEMLAEGGQEETDQSKKKKKRRFELA